MFKKQWLLPFVVITALSACANDDAEDDDDLAGDSAATPAATPAPPPQPTLGDPEIAHIATTANTLDIEGGNLAKTKAQNAEVKQFANRMVTEHTASNQEATQLAQSLALTPADNPNSQQMKSDHETAKATLQTATGADFDKAYIDHEVTMHQNVLNALDQQLIPSAQNAQLKALLEKARAMVSSHLEQAKTIQGKLGAAHTTTH